MNGLPDAVDVVIVGSGPVGSAFARVIKDGLPAATVVMVERGPVLTTPVGVNVRNLTAAERSRAQSLAEGIGRSRVSAFVREHGEPLISPRPGTQLVTLTAAGSDDQSGMPGALVANAVGGMGSFWTCAVPRPLGAERIPFIDATVLDAALSAGERLLGMTTEGYPRTAAGDLVLARLAAEFDTAGAPRVAPMPLAARRAAHEARPTWSGPAVVLGELASATEGEEGFWLLSERAATRILMDGNRAIGVETRAAGTEETIRIAARAVIVAADALRTPQLLWASGVRPEALGRYLNDQAQVVAAALLDGLDGEDAPDAGEAAPLDSDAAPKLDAELNHPFHGSPEGGQESVTGVTWIPFDGDHGRPVHGQVMQLDASPIAIGEADVRDPRPIIGIGFFAAKDLQPSDRVRFDPEEPDEFGLPALRIDYELTSVDRAALDTAVALARRTVAALGEYAPGGEPVILPAGSSIHYQGTVRMGPADDGTSVCDMTSRVWGTENLFVGGNGVIPTATGCNPTLTSVALATIAAREVIELIR